MKAVCGWDKEPAFECVLQSMCTAQVPCVFCSLEPLRFSSDIAVMLTRQESDKALLGKDIMFLLHWPETAMLSVVLGEKALAMVVMPTRNPSPHSLENGDKNDSWV